MLGDDRQPERIRAILSRYAGIRRDGAGLNAAADELDTMGTGPLATWRGLSSSRRPHDKAAAAATGVPTIHTPTNEGTST